MKRLPVSPVPMALALLLLPGPDLPAAVIRVPADQPTIQAGIHAAADGDTVLVADGEYEGPGNRDIELLGKAITVRSENGPAACVLDCNGSADRARRGFYIHHGEGHNTVVDGFTIQDGFLSDPDHPWTLGGGVGINCYQSSPTIRNCVIRYCGGHGPGLGILCSHGADALIENCTIEDNTAAYPGYGGAIYCRSASPLISGCVVSNNGHEGTPTGHGGICCEDGSNAEITGCTIRGNEASVGGGIYCNGSSPTIRNNTIEGNTAYNAGGGIAVTPTGGNPQVEDNLIRGNSAIFDGGGVFFQGSGGYWKRNTITGNEALSGGGLQVGQGGSLRLVRHVITGNRASDAGACSVKQRATAEFNGCTITDNEAGYGGCFYIYGTDTTVSVLNSVLWGNRTDNGGQVFLGRGLFAISWSDFEGGQGGVEQAPDTDLAWGERMIDADPLFVIGPGGDYYLSHAAAGQAVDSPCVDAGYQGSTPPNGTTRTDGVHDGDLVDLGYHYWPHESSGAAPDTVIEGGPDGPTDSPIVVFRFSGSDAEDPAGRLNYSWRLDGGSWSVPRAERTRMFTELAAGPHTFEVLAMDSDGNRDPTPAARQFEQGVWSVYQPEWQYLVTAPGPCVWNPPVVRTYFGEWAAYETPGWGARVASGDLDGDGVWDVVTGPGPGPGYGPHIQCFERDGGPITLYGFLAYGTASYGVEVAMGDLDGDGDDEIVTGAGPSPVFGPHVRGFDLVWGRIVQPMPGVSFFAYGTPRWGVDVAAGDIDGDGYDEIVTGAGPGAVFGPHVRAFDYDGGPTVTPIPGVSFFAYATLRWGVKTACGDLDGDGIEEIITGPGPSALFGPHVRAWSFDGGTVAPLAGTSFFAYADGWRFGVNVAAADTDGDGRCEILTMPGPDPAASARARVWAVDNGSVVLVRDFPAYDPWMTHGGTIAGVKPARRGSR